MNGTANGSISRVIPSIACATSTPGTPSRISGSCRYRWNSRTSASATCAIACPYTRTICNSAGSGSPAASTSAP